MSKTIFAQQNPLFEGNPIINAAATIGNYPATPFLYKIPTTGQRPIVFDVQNLPDGLALDKATGIISGEIKTAGNYEILVKAKNDWGTTEQKITIAIGDKLCLTPPMGWNSWNVYAADVTEDIIIKIADAMAANGMADLGYQYINIDDFWHANQREASGKPKVDSLKFPHGMKWLADYVHAKGLKLGIYSCAGKMTCGERFGGFGFEEIDAKTYAEWGIDLLKYDYCYAPWSRKSAESRYKAMGDALKKSGRSIVFSVCEWGLRKPWLWAEKVGGHYWRTTPDIFDVWSGGSPWQMSLMQILKRENKLAKYAGPGHWNDPDMLLVGNYGKGKATSAGGKFKGLTDVQYATHFALWCFLNAPLLSSADLGKLNPATAAILLDKNLIKINQDPLGKQALCVYNKNGILLYEKKLADNSTVWLMMNTTDKEITIELNDLFDTAAMPKAQRWNTSVNAEQETTLKLMPYEYELFRK